MHKNIVLSDIDNVLLTRLKFEADRQGIDLKTLIITIVRNSLGLSKIQENKILYNDLDYLSGKWTKKDYIDFRTNTSELDGIDPELWK